MQEKTSNIDVKKINKNKIFQYICQQQKTSNAAIARALQMSMPTVLQNTRELLAEGIVEEMGYFESTGGRKAKMLSPVWNKKLAVGIDITRNHIGLALVNLAGDILKHKRVKMTFRKDDDYFRTLGKLVSDFVDEESVERDVVLGVGVSIAGIVDVDRQYIVYSHVLDIQNSFRDEICQYIPWECYLINDANASAMAELWAMENNESFVYLFLSNSVGGAVIYEGKIFTGSSYSSGEFGHVCVEAHGMLCRCGKHGCLDPYCSAHAIESQGYANLQDFFAALEKGEAKSQAVWQDYSEYLLRAVDILYMAFDSDIVLGGHVGKYLDTQLDELRKRAGEKDIFGSDGHFLKVCRYYEEASALGAALHYVDAFIQSV